MVFIGKSRKSFPLAHTITLYYGMSNTLLHPSAISPLLTVKDACAYLQCTAKYLERAVRAGRLRALKPSGKFLRFRQADLDAFMDNGATIH
jgi:excisionase family DNA binding protein